MTIIDLDGKIREIKSIKKIKHQIEDIIFHTLIDEEFIEVMIVGENREWIQWYPLKEFKELNPQVRI